MKQIVYSCIIIASLICISCSKQSLKIASGIPDCIYDEIKNNQENSDWMFAKVEEYRFQNKLVYAFQPDEKRIADGATIIKDADCVELCQVGGFGGPAFNMCNGDNFFQTAVLKRVIWKKY